MSASSAVEIANAYISLTVQTPGLKKELADAVGASESSLEQAGSSGGTKWGKMFAVAAAAVASAAVTKAIVGFTKNVVDTFGELEQNIGGSEAVFGQFADTVQDKGSSAYKTLGISQSEYLATANKMGALFQGSGMEQQKSLELTTKAMQRAADMASVMGIEQSVAMESVAGAAKGNFTMMDNLGVAMNATSIEAYAASKGMTDWSFATATAAEKSEMAMAMFFESTEQYAGNFEREAMETVSGSMGMLAASWQEMIAGLGSSDADMGQLSSNLVESFGAVVKNVTPVVVEMFKSIPEAIRGVVQSIGAQFGIDLSWIDEIIGGITAFVAAFNAADGDITSSGFAGFLEQLGWNARQLWDALSPLISQFVELWQSLSPLSLAFKVLAPLLPDLMDMFAQLGSAILPIVATVLTTVQQIMAQLIPVVMQVFQAFVPIVQQILPVIVSLFQQLAPIITSVVEALIPMLQPVLSLVTPLLNLVTAILPPLVELFGVLASVILPMLQMALDFIIPVVTGVVDAISTMLIPIIEMLQGYLSGIIEFLTGVFTGNWEQAWNGIVGIFTSIWDGMRGIVVGVINGIIDLINGAINGINDIAGGVADFTGGLIDVRIPTIPHLATGGIVKRTPGGIPAVIGEGRYDEAVVPLSPTILGQLGGGGGPQGPLVEVHAGPGMDAGEVGRIAADEVAWTMRGAS